MDKKINQKAKKKFSEAKTCNYSGVNFNSVYQGRNLAKYTGEEDEHGQLLRWMRQLGYHTGIKTGKPNIVSNLYPMAQKKIIPDKQVKNEEDFFEN